MKRYYCCAIRGRYNNTTIQQYNNTTIQQYNNTTIQMLEISGWKVANCITTVNKDCMILEIDGCMTNRQTDKQTNRQTDDTDLVFIRQATIKGYIECSIKKGGIFDCSYPTSKIRRGRVQGGGGISPTLMTGSNAIVKINRSKNMKYRIRKLTPKECYRLMGTTEKDFDSASKVVSNSQLYKIAGNAIVVPVLMGLFSQLGIKGCKRWNDMSLDEKKEVIYKGTILENKEPIFLE